MSHAFEFMIRLDNSIMGVEMSSIEKEIHTVNIAVRLRELREERNYSMRSLAQKSGLSANALSVIERGRTSPSVSTLYKIAEALDVPITSFFAPGKNRRNIVFIKSQERSQVPLTNGIWAGLGGEQFVGRVEPFILTLDVGGGSGEKAMEHNGHEFVYCMYGQIEYKVEDQIFNLENGDSLLFSAHLEHRWKNTSQEISSILIVLSNFPESDQPLSLHLEEERGIHPEPEKDL
jgi:transcriptional regulator with XRE-family HTH domain